MNSPAFSSVNAAAPSANAAALQQILEATSQP